MSSSLLLAGGGGYFTPSSTPREAEVIGASSSHVKHTHQRRTESQVDVQEDKTSKRQRITKIGGLAIVIVLFSF